MKVVTLGLSPFLMAARSKAHAMIMKYLYLTGNTIASAVWGHNEKYFIPKESEDGNKQFYYDFEYADQKHEIPIFPFVRGRDDSIYVYEILNQLQPEIVITIGDVSDFSYMHAVKSFYPHNLKWLHVALQYNNPINDDHAQILSSMDGILCTSRNCQESMQNLFGKDLMDMHYVGCNPKIYNFVDKPDNPFRIMASPKVSQSDCAPTIMSCAPGLSKEIPGLEIYLHSNVEDPGDHNLHALRDRFDPKGEIIKFPEKYVSLMDGMTELEMSQEMQKSHVFVSIPMVTATSMSVLQAIACGCYPVMSDCGTNRDIAKMLSDFLGDGYEQEDFLVPSIEIMAAGDTYLNVCGKEDLQKTIARACIKVEKDKGLNRKLSEFIPEYSQGNFLKKVVEMATSVLESESALCLDV